MIKCNHVSADGRRAYRSKLNKGFFHHDILELGSLVIAMLQFHAYSSTCVTLFAIGLHSFFYQHFVFNQLVD